MAVLYITEYVSTGTNNARLVPVGLEIGADQTLAISGTSGQSVALKNSTQLVRLHTDAICSVLFGANPTAVIASGTAGSKRLAANQTEYFAVPVNSGYKIAVISTT